MEDIYITIPSSSPYLNNSSTDFTVQLETPIYLNKPYEVALTEINFKNSYRRLNAENDRVFRWTFIYEGRNKIKKIEDVWKYHLPQMETFKIPNVDYKNINEIITAVNNEISNYISTLNTQLHPIHLLLKENKNKIHVNHKDVNQYINFNYTLSKIFGFDKDTWYGFRKSLSDYNIDFVPHLSHLHIYCDIIEPQVVNNQKVSLLRHVITAKEEIGSYVNKIFNKPYYKKIQHNSLNLIRIWLLDELGQVPSIGNSEVIVVLHFKPI